MFVITQKHRDKLLNPYYIDDVHYEWCRRMALAESHTEQQAETMLKMYNMIISQQRKYIIFNDQLVPCTSKHRWFSKDQKGNWVMRTRLNGKYQDMDK